VARDPGHNKYWFPPINNVDLWFNVTTPPFDNKVVRQAFAYAIDRTKVSKIGEYGYEPAGNQTGVITPTFSSWVDSSEVSKYGFDTAKATSLLQGAGFTKNSSGIFQDPSGKPLSFHIINIGGFTDWVAALQVVQANLKDAGIDVKVDNLSSDAYYHDLFNGKFQLAYGGLQTAAGPSPYFELRNSIHSATTAAIGQPAGGDYGRYRNPAVDGLLDQFGGTTDTAKQHSLMSQVVGVMLDDVPFIPVTEGVAWYQWTTKGFAGWPTPADQYAAPAPWNLRVYKTS
jgi:peptide/nickel transport system substrate-binding protein